MARWVRITEVNDLVVMHEYQSRSRADLPTEIAFLKIEITGTPTGAIDVRYSWIANHTLSGAEDIEQLVNMTMDDPTHLNWRRPQVTPGGPSRLSLRNKDLRYFVFLLEQGNYQFAAKQFPFRVQSKKETYFYEAKVAWKEGADYKHQRMAKIGYPSKIGYFIANSDEDISDFGEPFESHFNIYLDLDYGNSDTVPISVDPDVGYPGGNS